MFPIRAVLSVAVILFMAFIAALYTNTNYAGFTGSSVAS
jgi:hypothetical protein